METKPNLPLYKQIKEKLLQTIKDSEPGELLPPELELQNIYSVSRATIRNALNELENEDLILRKPGVGSVILQKKIEPDLMKLTSFSELMRTRGIKPAYKTLNVQIVEPPATVRKLMGADDIQRLWYVQRLCLGDKKTYALHQLYLPPHFDFSPNELWNMKSYYGLIAQKFKLTPKYADETITALSADAELAEILNVKVNDPLIEIWRTTYSEEWKSIEVIRIIYIAETFAYKIRLYA